MEIVVTARQLLDKNMWGHFCELRDMNEWAINEGLMDDTERLSLTEEEAIKLGIIREG